MPLAVPASPEEVIISMLYDDRTGLETVDMYDNKILGWIVDEVEPQTFEPAPRIIGQLPQAPPATAPVLSPTWASLQPNGVVYVPDIFRGRTDEFFTWLATNNNATRKLRSNFSQQYLMSAWDSWARMHPELVWAPDPA